jgi:hypothetical protein
VKRPDGSTFEAFGANIQANQLQSVLQDENPAASVVWRRQNDAGVHSWSGKRIFPKLTIIRAHQVPPDDPHTPQLKPPSTLFLELLKSVKETVARIARNHGESFGGFAIGQLEKKLTSSSIAGACSLFTWAIRRCHWDTQEKYRDDKGKGTEGLRQLIRQISQRIAEGNPQTQAGHASVYFPSDHFEFSAGSLSQKGVITDIQKYSRTLRDDDSADKWIATDCEICELVSLGQRLLGVGPEEERVEGAQDNKLEWLQEMLRRHPEERFILFTESLQTCETLKNALGNVCTVLHGSLNQTERLEAVQELRNPKGSVRILVATSAGDEGIDLQVASKVIHWDLSSSPATLMQRNGRAARLGQVKDVVAYYLILRGTHEERRDSSLQTKFAELGIDDEAMKSRILGSLSEKEEQDLEQAIEDNDDGIAGEILAKAKRDNEEMDSQLQSISAALELSQVLSRDDLAERLKNWNRIGLPEEGLGNITYKFEEITWNRPVFEESGARSEPAVSPIAIINDRDKGVKQALVFDPEFLVFGGKQGGERLRLGGLPPWINKPDYYGKHAIIPSQSSDILGKLFQKVARLGTADFLTIPVNALEAGLLPPGTRWLLFCTHPLREVEDVLPTKVRPYLTYYAFRELNDPDLPVPVDVEGADADHVHRFLECVEKHAVEGKCIEQYDKSQIDAATHAGSRVRTWLQSVTKFGVAKFLEPAKYFVPIPVALVSIEDKKGGESN